MKIHKTYKILNDNLPVMFPEWQHDCELNEK